MNAILDLTFRKGDAHSIPNVASMLACGAPVSAIAPNLKRCLPQRVAWMESGSHRMHWIVRQERRLAAGMPVAVTQRSRRFSLTHKLSERAAPDRSHMNDTRSNRRAAHLTHRRKAMPKETQD